MDYKKKWKYVLLNLVHFKASSFITISLGIGIINLQVTSDEKFTKNQYHKKNS